MSCRISGKQTSKFAILDRHMEINAGDVHVRMPSGITNFGKGATTCQGMTDKCMPPVVNCKGPEPLEIEACADHEGLKFCNDGKECPST